MSMSQPTKPESDPQRSEQLKQRRANYKTPEFRESITDAFHKAKLHALDDQSGVSQETTPVEIAQ